MTENLIKIIGSGFPLRKSDIGDFALLKAGGMTFHINRYDAERLGVVSVMSATGMMGLMKMTTLIINPVFRDCPLYSYDSIKVPGRRTDIFEIYDTMLGVYNNEELMKVRKSAEKLPEHSVGEHWYDSIKTPASFALRGGRKYYNDFDKTVNSSITAFVASAAESPDCNPNEKRIKASTYVNGLLKHGGPSTDVFKKTIGDEKTSELFQRVLFGTTE